MARSRTPAPPPALDSVVGAAHAAASTLAATTTAERAAMLHRLAEVLDRHRGDIVATAHRETRLGVARLDGELDRTRLQLLLFADVLRDGGYLEAMIDRPDPQAAPAPRPDIRRMLRPLGPVAVFAASNFPLAFSVLGGDTASALAAGCPVVLKAHEGHPDLSDLVAELAAAVLPAGALAVVHGRPAGAALLLHPLVTAAGFTGSPAGGQALLALVNSRPDPIPFYGELGSVNPVIVTPAAVKARGEQIATEFVASFTLGQGQFCTKPGLLFVPEGHGLTALLQHTIRSAPAAQLLGGWIEDGFRGRLDELIGLSTVEPIVLAEPADHGVGPSLLRTTAGALRTTPEAAEECFGPAALLVEYRDEADLLDTLGTLPAGLTVTMHGELDADAALARTVLGQARAGRLIWNGWPTGVAVSWAMQHGGPWPATNGSLHTSVGATAIRRWLRPVAFQNVPDALLPPPLQDANPWRVPRRDSGR